MVHNKVFRGSDPNVWYFCIHCLISNVFIQMFCCVLVSKLLHYLVLDRVPTYLHFFSQNSRMSKPHVCDQIGIGTKPGIYFYYFYTSENYNTIITPPSIIISKSNTIQPAGTSIKNYLQSTSSATEKAEDPKCLQYMF